MSDARNNFLSDILMRNCTSVKQKKNANGICICYFNIVVDMIITRDYRIFCISIGCFVIIAQDYRKLTSHNWKNRVEKMKISFVRHF